MKFDDLLEMNGINPKECRYLRHVNSELNTAGWKGPVDLFKQNVGDFKAYQSVLSRNKLGGAKYIVSLAAHGGKRAMFLGVYENHLVFMKPHPPHWQRGLIEIENRLMQFEIERRVQHD